ncbi:MAG: DUF4388 domain-containing protein [Candidatus Manganitrophaceae bacterium]
MSLEGRLEDLGLSDIFHIISLSKRSGILTIIRKEGTARLVFNKGLLIYGISDGVHRLGNTLIQNGIITTDALEKALKIQKTKEMQVPIGEILQKMGAISIETLDDQLRNQLIEVVRDILNWKNGAFHFELGNPASDDHLLREGIHLEFLMMEVFRRQDEYNPDVKKENSLFPESNGGVPSGVSSPEQTNDEVTHPALMPFPESSESTEESRIITHGSVGLTYRHNFVEGSRGDSTQGSNRKDLALLTSMIEELSGPASGSEAILLLLRFASEIMNRAIIFLVRWDDVVGFGQSGLSFEGESADEKIREVRIALHESSLFQKIIEKKEVYKGPLGQEKWHRYFIDQIGGEWPKEVFLTPLLNGSEVIALLYGDNVPDQTPISETEGLEAFVRVASVALGKAKLERKLEEVRQRGSE